MELSRIFFKGEEIWRAYKNHELIWHQKTIKFFSAEEVEVFTFPYCELKTETAGLIYPQHSMLGDLKKLSFFLDRSKNVGRKASTASLENFQINLDLTKIRQASNIFSILEDWELNLSMSEKIEKALSILNVDSWSLILDKSAILKKTEEIESCSKNLLALSPSKKMEKRERISFIYLENFCASFAKPEQSKTSIHTFSLIYLANSPTREIEKKEQIKFNIIKKLNAPGTEYVWNNNIIRILLDTKQRISLIKELVKKDYMTFLPYFLLRNSITKEGNKILRTEYNLNIKINYSFVKEYDKTWLIVNNYYVKFILSKIEKIKVLESASICIDRFPIDIHSVKRKTSYGNQRIGVNYEYDLLSSKTREIIKRHTLALLKHVNFFVRERKELLQTLKNQIVNESLLFESLAIYSLLNKNVSGRINSVLFNSESRLGHYQKTLEILNQSELNNSFAFEYFLKKQITSFWNKELVNNIDAELRGSFCTKENKETSSLAILERPGKTEELKFIISERNYSFFDFQMARAHTTKAKFVDHIETNFGMSISLKELYSLVKKRAKSYSYLKLDGNLNSFQGEAVTYSRECVSFEFLDFIGYFTFNVNNKIKTKLIEEMAKRGEGISTFGTLEKNILYTKKEKRFALQKRFSLSSKGNADISEFIFLYPSMDFLAHNKTNFSVSVFENLQISYKNIDASRSLLFLGAAYKTISYLRSLTHIEHASKLASTVKKIIVPLGSTISSLDALSTLTFSDEYHWLYPERREITNLYIQQVYDFSYSNKNIQ